MSAARRYVLRSFAAILLSAAFPVTLAAGEGGRFIGTIVAQWADNGRDMTLIQPFEFVDPNGQHWPVPAGATVNGASIPRIFWSLIGGPFEGLYRNASVVHDYYCDVQLRSYREVHRVFYEAMLASGVDSSTAWLMYEAVNRFGPRWAEANAGGSCGPAGEPCTRGFAAPDPAQPEINKLQLETFLADVEDKANPKDVAKLREAIGNLR